MFTSVHPLRLLAQLPGMILWICKEPRSSWRPSVAMRVLLKKRQLDSMGEGEGGMFQENNIETCILSRVKRITSPGWMHETSARTWCSGRTWRELVGREVGGGIGMGKTCKLKDDSFQCMTKFTTNKKKKKKKKSDSEQFCRRWNVCQIGG